MRSKEDAQDYRYFPEPDLLTIVVPQEKVDELKATLPELPNAKIMRYISDYSLTHADAAMIVDVPEKSKYFEDCIDLGCSAPKLAANWILGEISKVMNEGVDISSMNVTPKKLVKIINYISSGKISTASGKIVFDAVMESGADVDSVIEEKSLAQVSDVSALEELAKKVISENEKSVQDYKNGKTNALGYLVGQCMKASKGKANPSMMKELVLKYLN